MHPSVNETHPGWVPPVRTAILAIVLATLAVYGGFLRGPLIYDDHLWITWNPSIQHLRPIGAVLAPPADSAVRARPVLSLSLALNYAVSGTDPGSYHLANLAIHILAALALFGVSRRTLGYRPASFPTERDRVIPAFALALLWAVHPLLTASVTYVIQRAESLMGLFYLLTLYCFIRGVQSPRVRLWPMLSVLACALGMATKEVMVTAPLIVLAYDRTFVSGSVRAALALRWRLYLSLAGTWMILAGLDADLHGRGVGFGLGYSWWAYGLVECWVVAHYALLAFWPHPLVFEYGTSVVSSLREVIPWACALALLAGITGLAFARRSALGFAGLWFFLILAPTSSVVPVAFQPMAENRMYLSLAAVVALVVAGGWSLLGSRSLPLFLAAAGALGMGTVLRNTDYRSEIAIWGDTVLRRPNNGRARLALGSALVLAGRDAEAADQFREALRIDPGDPEARRNLGFAFYHLGRIDDALAQYRSIARPSPDSAILHYDIGLALDRAGRTDEAAKEYADAVRLNPSDGEARNNLGSALYRMGRVDDALIEYSMALRFRGASAQVHFNMGMALARKGGVERAVAQYREAIRLQPDYAEAHNNLAYLLAQSGHVADAMAEYKEALRIRPGYEMALANLAQLQSLPPAPAASP